MNPHTASSLVARVLPTTTLDGTHVTSAAALGLLERWADHIEITHAACHLPDGNGEPLVAASTDLWDYRGDDLDDLSRAILTRLLVWDEDPATYGEDRLIVWIAP